MAKLKCSMQTVCHPTSQGFTEYLEGELCVSSKVMFSGILQVETVDRGGSFLGTIITKGPKSVNLGLALLSNGLAKLHPSFEPSRVPGGKDLAVAESRARDKRLKVLLLHPGRASALSISSQSELMKIKLFLRAFYDALSCLST